MAVIAENRRARFEYHIEEQFEAGMVLANGIYSPHGLLLIGEGTPLSPGTISKIRSHNQVAPINQRLLVYS